MAVTPLNSLGAFVAVARRRSFAAAARELGVSTSALSQSVRQLEERLAVGLLTRTSRSVNLTEAGLRLLGSAGPAVDAALESLKSVSALPGEVTGRIRLSVPTAAVSMVLADVLPPFRQRYPNVEVDAIVENRFVDIVKEGFDAGIRLVEAVDRDMVHVQLSPACRLVVAGAPSYFARAGIPKKPEDLLRHDCIGVRLGANGEPWAWELERGKKAWRIPVRGCVSTNDATLAKSLGLSGVGLIYALEPLIAQEVARGELRLALEAYAPEVPGLFLYFPQGARTSSAFRAFVDLARATMRTPKKRAR
jgi:DNA-binding transcriptional LysR family regulator